ncbi:sensor histidine kinase [Mucilaginibacter terrae]|uniref:histidine kinase n=1 Tax=Mucilaginibacter terrae TaxID=1955052 RepID=A0ABU3GQU6_9SPHI|nr:sensor histidine kinase [Mucilaginibacter terrae]MDT3402136.1 two-component sensor histidine kinase [Mucilaginibacter terrae]
MAGYLHSNHLKFAFILLFLIHSVKAIAQVDYKNSLPELYNQLKNTNNDTNTFKLALTICSFYQTNKGIATANVDSAKKYLALAERISQTLSYKGADDATIMRVRLLLRNKGFAAVRTITAKATGAMYCRINIETGRYYLEKGGEDKADLEIAAKHFAIAEAYALQHHMPVLYNTARLYKYPLMCEQRIAPEKCEEEFEHLVALSKSFHNKHIEAQAFYLKALYLEDDSLSKIWFNKTIPLAEATKNIGLAIHIRKEIADRNIRLGNLNEAETELLDVLKRYKLAGYRNLQFTYDLLTAVNITKANFEAAMRYGLQTIRYADSTGTESSLNIFQFRLANICRDMGLKKESLKWSRACLNSTIRLENRFPYLVYRELATDMIKEGKAEQVLQVLAYNEKKYPPEYQGKFFLPLLRADCYTALNKPRLAEQNYLKTLRLFEGNNMRTSYYYLCCKSLAQFYINQKLYAKAEPLLHAILNKPYPVFSMNDLASAHLLQFKLDSAKGYYPLAIKHLKRSKAITDSIFNFERLKQSEQLQLQFDMSQREHENLTLRSKNSLQQSELEKEALSRKLISLALCGSVIITALMLYLYRAKQKSNNLLKTTQDEINVKNDRLNQLLVEKEWLMKEIHHRVKNNLQIISSLLNTQSSYLNDEEALSAIRDSQNRMQAISIVHQKLYQSDDISTISFAKYLRELSRSIQDSFNVAANIRFVFDVKDTKLNTADTVPLGLILNEAITNSIKYAFKNQSNGTITISALDTANGYFQLLIQDNGKGLPEGFDIDHCTTLGMNLMKGLTEQLNGEFKIHSKEGVTITVTFKPSAVELTI